MRKNPFEEARQLQLFRYFRSTIILALVAIVLVLVTLLVTVRVQAVSGREVGVKVNNRTGEIEVIASSGTYIYNGILSTFHVLDATIQTLEMVQDPNRGDRAGRDDLRIKTIDGSNVYLDLTVNYRMRPDKVVELVNGSGLGDAYKHKWVRDYSRAICRKAFGELTTEEFYDASLRTARAVEAKEELNTMLEPHGIEIVQVIASDFSFHPKYEEKIREKKLADQEVEAEISRKAAAEERQKFRVVEATKEKEVAIVKYEGEMRQMVVEAEANAERVTRGAEAYAIRTRRDAEAQFYQKDKNAQALIARARAEAEGLKRMAEALLGEGGRNLVKLEYAKRLANMAITGQPFTVSGQTERFSHVEEGPAPVSSAGARAAAGEAAATAGQAATPAQ